VNEAGPPELLPRPRRIRLEGRARVRPAGAPLQRRDPALAPEGYRLAVGHDGTVAVTAADDAGRFYAEATLAQLARLCPADAPGTLPVGEVEDWPDLAVRGVMLDVSRTKVPTLDTLFGLVDRIASWKLNHLQLYIEHTFAYPGHEEVWEGADPYDAGDLARLSAHCARRHVTLAANRNCLGHMERWLMHDRYAPLGILRGVGRGPMGIPFPASTLDPAKPESLALVGELVGGMVEAVPSHVVHVGLDEPWDLPASRATEWGRWLGALRSLPQLEGRHLLVWGDMPAAHPELLEQVGALATVCEWGYEADHPFGARLEALAEAGVPRWVAPGTSSWLSVVGRTSNAVDNCRRAAAAALAFDADGLLVTDWGDFGHLQPLAVSDPGLAVAAGVSWCAAANDALDPPALARLLDRHCYGDGAGALGGALVSLGDAHLLQPVQLPNVSGLVLHLYFPQLPVGPALHPELSSAHLGRVQEAIDDAVDALGRARPTDDHGRLAVEELEAAAGLVRLCATEARARLEGDGTIGSVPQAVRTALETSMNDVIDAHRQRWLARNRPGGLDESCAWLEHVRSGYRQGGADEDWAGPLVAAARAHQARR
jgi:hexosaminidase